MQLMFDLHKLKLTHKIVALHYLMYHLPIHWPLSMFTVVLIITIVIYLSHYAQWCCNAWYNTSIYRYAVPTKLELCLYTLGHSN